MNITIIYNGLSGVLPRNFEEFYLGIEYSGEREYSVQTKQININIEVSFKFAFFLSSMGMQYYSWIDGFLDTLDRSFSSNYFLRTIEWDSALTVIEFLDKYYKRHDSFMANNK